MQRLIIFFLWVLGSGFRVLGEAGQPNILWLTSEDNSPYLGCYGDPQAKTPHLDAFAAQGVRYRHAFSSAPVCSAARSTLITGMNACTLGIHNHRSSVRVPDSVVYYPQLFRKAGYYCTNNSKTDYNMQIGGRRASAEDVGWHESSNKAHYKNRPDKARPFFAVFNTTISHEGQTTDQAFRNKRGVLDGKRVVPPEEVKLPPYHPDTPVIRENWSRYFDNIWRMDQRVGELLEELEESGEAENTIVFYYSDHGGALPRGKRNIHDSGTRVPFIIRFPDKWKHLAPAQPGEWVDDLVAFVDFPATVANLCGLEIPDIWEGKPFLGPGAVKRDHVFLFRGRMDERFDTVRAIRTREFLFVKNFSPHRPYGQAYTYPFNVLPSMRSWYETFKAGKCDDVQARYWQPKAPEEFYAIKDDPHQINNLIDDPAHHQTIMRLWNVLVREMLASRDTGLIPEGMIPHLIGERTLREFALSEAYPISDALSLAVGATSHDERRDMRELLDFSKAESPILRYWAAMGAVVAGKEAAPMKERLLELLADPVPDVRVAAAEALGNLGETERAVPVLVEALKAGNEHEALAAITALEAFGRSGVLPMEKVQELIPEKVPGDANRVVEAIEKIR